jgi:hypothetical protein
MTGKESMAGTTTYIRTYNYDVCLSTGKLWTLVEAVDYLATYLVSKGNWSDRDDAFQGFIAIKNRLLMAMKKDIDEGNLDINEVYLEDCATGAAPGHIDAEKSTVRPIIFISWAVANDIEVPKEFVKYANSKKSKKTAYYEVLGLKRSTIHHERCRAVAELLWSMEPGMPINLMAQRKEIIQYGCEGQQYDVRTISRWLATLKADRRPGQPGKKRVKAEEFIQEEA